ncbi:MAG: hypothetical protein Q8O92_11605 [Candidatus Latescibacter sp.]|nr:hypothetical protein [Candidatus Latescibacter sp.]
MDKDTPDFDFLDDFFRSAEKGKTPLGRTAPFKFLDPYGPEDKGIYFGRKFEVAEVYARFFKTRILVVYGESGSGKTSLVQCGLRSEIPPEDAAFLTIRSASDPLEALERELVKYTGFGEDAPESLKEMLKEAIFRKGKPLALLFDQFEEFFLFQPPSVREAFVRELAAWVEADLNIRVIFVIREEYLARMTELETVLPELLQNRIWVRRMSREQAKEVIISPCRACNVGIEEGLADALLDDLTRSGGVELPILQVVMDSLYRRAIANDPDSPSLTISEYQEMGKVESILARFIEETVESHPQPERVRQVLKALVTAEGTKRISSLEQIIENAAPFGEPLDAETLVPILRSLIDRRVLREDADSRLYELRHDALAIPIRQWMTGLEQELVEVRQTLENRFKEYQHRGTVLDAQTIAWIAPYEARLRLNPDMRFFVETSRRAAVRKRRIALTLAGAAVGVFVIVVSALGLLSYKKYLDSERNMGYVFTERARQAYETQDYNAARLNSLYALTKLKGKDTETSRAEAAGYFTLSPEYPVVFDVQRSIPVQRSLTGLDFSPDGTTIALSQFYDNSVTLWDVRTGNLKATLTGGVGQVMRQRFSPDGSLIAACFTADRAVRIWDARSYKSVALIENLAENPWNVSFSPDGRLLAFGLTDGTIHIWDLPANKEFARWNAHTGPVWMVVFSPDSTTIASSSADGSVGLWNVRTRELIKRFKGHIGNVWGLCFSPDGKTLASSADDGTIRIWDVAARDSLKVLRGHNAIAWDVDFSPDGKLLVSAALDIRFWDTRTWQQKAVLPTGDSGKVKFSPDGTMVVSGGMLRFWDVRTAASLKSAVGHGDSVLSLAFSPDGFFLITGSRDRTLRLWELKTGRQTGIWENSAGPISSACIFPEGNRIAVGSNDGIVKILNISLGEISLTLPGHTGQVRCLCLSPGQEFLASASADSTVRIWNLQTGNSRVLRGHAGRVNSACFSPNGSLLATGSDDGTIRLWDSLSGRNRGVLSGRFGKILNVFYALNDTALVSVSGDKTVAVWNTATLGISASFREDRGEPQTAAVSTDGGLIALGLAEGGVMLWNLRSQTRIAFIPTGASAVTALGFSPDGRLLAAGTAEGGIRVWDVSPGLRVTRNRIPESIFGGVIYSPDGSVLWLMMRDRIYAWDVRKEYPKRSISIPGLRYTSTVTAEKIASVNTGNIVQVWDVQTGRVITLPEAVIANGFVDLSPDGSAIIFPGTDGVARIWDLSAKRILHTLGGGYLGGSSWVFYGNFFLPDGTHAMTVGADGWVQILDMRDGKLNKVFMIPASPRASAISSDRTSLAVMDSLQTIHVWDIWTGQKRAVINPRISIVRSRSLSLSHDGSRLLVASADGSVQVFNVKAGNMVSSFHAPAVDMNSAIRLSPNGALVVATGSDHIIRFWNADTGKPMISLTGHNGVIMDRNVAFSPDGFRLAISDPSSFFHIWDMETVSLLSSTPIQKLITHAETQSRLTMKRFKLEPDTPKPNLFGTPPKPPVWPARHPFHWLDSADKGDVNTMLKLGAIYERSGETDKALQWYQKAAQKGNMEGKKRLEALQTKFKTTSGNPK